MHDIVHETRLLDAALPYLLPPLPTDAAASPAVYTLPQQGKVVQDACAVLTAIAQHPYGQAWLLARGGVDRALQLKAAVEQRRAGGAPPDAVQDSNGGSGSDWDASGGAQRAAAALVEALMAQPVVDEPVDTAAFLAALRQAPSHVHAHSATSGASAGRSSGGSDEAGEDGHAGSDGATFTSTFQADTLLRGLASASSHDEFMEHLVELQALCNSDSAAAAAVTTTGKWQEPLQRFLEVRCREDEVLEWTCKNRCAPRANGLRVLMLPDVSHSSFARCPHPCSQRPPMSAADDVVFVQVTQFLCGVLRVMPVQEALLLLYACRDNLLPLLHSDSVRPRVRCAVLNLVLVLCSAGAPPASVTSKSSIMRTLFHGSGSDGSAPATGTTTPQHRPAAATRLTQAQAAVVDYVVHADDVVTVASEAISVVLDAGLLRVCCRTVATVPSDMYLQTQVRGTSEVDDVRMGALALIVSVVCHDGVQLTAGQRRDVDAAAEDIIRALVGVASHFRSPDAAARNRALALAIKVLWVGGTVTQEFATRHSTITRESYPLPSPHHSPLAPVSRVRD